jgi:hypothetical protein
MASLLFLTINCCLVKFAFLENYVFGRIVHGSGGGELKKD